MRGLTGQCQTAGPTGTGPVSVLLVDDHPLFRDAIRHAVEKYADLHVVGEAGDGDEAVRLVATLKPSVVVLDIGLPGTNGITLCRQITSLSPTTAVLVLTVHNDAQHVSTMLQNGATGFLTKDVLGAEVVDAIRRVAMGEQYLCAAAVRQLVSSVVSESRMTDNSAMSRLTTRETEVLTLLAQGRSNREIAHVLSLSTSTVKGHLEGIFGKLGVDTRTQAVTAALRLGILQAEDLRGPTTNAT